VPLYSYACSRCGREQDAYRRVSSRNRGPKCCGETAKKIITGKYSVFALFTPYRAVGLPGRPWIKTLAEHKAQLREHGREEIGNDRSMQPEMEATDREWQHHQQQRKAQIERDAAETTKILANLSR
jgi:hypothetical protein